MAGFALAAFTDRSAALALTYRPVTQPLAFAALVAGLVGLPLLSGAGMARFAGVAPSEARTGTRGLRLTREQVAVLAALSGIMALGLGLRLYHLHHLSFWLDETATIYFSRRSWPFVLGLEGGYDTHPPLYYALVKLTRFFVLDVSAGRLTSVIAGVATLPVLAALVARLSNWRAGLVAALILAVSPLHVWYSQEARMYTPVVLLLALSYLALVVFAQTASRAWAIVYGVSVVLALYMDYSAIYALAPQAFALMLITWRWRRAALPIWGCALGAICCFLPWIPTILTTIDAEGRNREGFLGASPAKALSVAQSLVGLKNQGNYLWGPIAPFWEQPPTLQAVLLAGMLVTALFGASLLARRSPIGLVTALGLLFGTFTTAIIVSLISPGFAERTVLAAVLGWAILLGTAACGSWSGEASSRWLPRWYNAAALVGIALTLVASGASLRAFYAGATKENNRALAAAAAQGARAGVPVIVEGWLAAATTAYHPELPIGSGTIIGEAEQFWWAYGDYAWNNTAAQRAEYERQGYVRLMHWQYDAALFLDYYARPDALPPGAVPLDLATSASAWKLPPGTSRDEPGAVRLAGEGTATLTLPDVREGLHLLAVETGGAKQGRARFSCLGAGNALLATFPSVETAPGELWLAALCPSETVAVTIVLRGEQQGGAEFRGLRLWSVPGDAVR
jgi:4-amino-4-deoxy-L-arabinose transferase-like glycosyltransferase